MVPQEEEAQEEALPPIRVAQQIGNETQSGDVDLSFSVESTGDNPNQGVTPLRFGNTGGNRDAQRFLQFDSEADHLPDSGSTFEFAPDPTAPYTQAVQQLTAASG